MSKRFRIAKRISMEDIDHFEDVEVDDDFVDKDMVQIIADNEYDPMYDDCESIAVALQLAGYGKVANLETKLSESEENCFDLQQRLADKEEQITKFMDREIENEKQLEKQASIHYGHLKEVVSKINQDKIEFAVEQLTEIRDYVKECWSLDTTEGKVRLDIAKKIRLKIEELTHQEDKGE